MGTRSAVAVRDKTTPVGFKGRYVHWDGYPSGVGAEVRQLIERDGREQVIKTIIEENYGWSTLDLQQRDELPEGYRDGRFKAVPGYGVAYTEFDGQSSPNDWVTDFGQNWTEYIHIIEEDGSVTSYTSEGVIATEDED